MSFVKNSTLHSNFSARKELKWQLSEAAHHLQQFQDHIDEALDHFKKYVEAISLAEIETKKIEEAI